MVLHFETKRNKNGHRNFLEINTEKKTYSTTCPYIIPWSDSVEIKEIDRKLLINIAEEVYEFKRED